MGEYRYRAKDGPEKIIEGILEAPTEEAAVDKVMAMGYIPTSIVPAALSGPNRPTALSILTKTRRQSDRQLMRFCRHLASLFKSGVPILNALYLLGEQEKDPVFRRVLLGLARQIKEGASFSQALGADPHIFAPMIVSILHAGESSGALPESLSRVAAYLKKQDQTRSKVARAMAYPTLLAFTGLGTVVFIMMFVVPKISKLFINLKQELPLPTRIVMGAGDFLSAWWPMVAAVAAGLIVLLRALKSKPKAMAAWDATRLKIPLYGNFYLKAELARFARTLEIALSNGIAFLEALRVSAPTLSNVLLRDAINQCEESVQKGDPFGKCLRRYDAFPHFMTDLILIGEETGRLEEVLAEIAESYEQETDEFAMTLTTLIEPVMILAIGAVVGFIVIAMMLPMFEISAVL